MDGNVAWGGKEARRGGVVYGQVGGRAGSEKGRIGAGESSILLAY